MNNGEIGAPGSVGTVTSTVDAVRPGVGPDTGLARALETAPRESQDAGNPTAEQARVDAFADRVAEPTTRIPPNYDASLEEAAKGLAADKVEGLDAQQQAQIQEKNRQEAFRDITEKHEIAVDATSDPDVVLARLVAKKGWTNNPESLEWVKEAIKHAQEQSPQSVDSADPFADQPEVQPPGAAASAVVAEVIPADTSVPVVGVGAESRDETPPQGPAGGGENPDPNVSDSSRPETADAAAGQASGEQQAENAGNATPASGEQAPADEQLTPEQQEIRALRGEVQELRGLLALTVEAIENEDRRAKILQEIKRVLALAVGVATSLGSPIVEAELNEMQRSQ